MNYAWIENGLVTNIIWLYPGNADEFPQAVPLGDRAVTTGDAYIDGVFYRDGQPILTPLEAANAALAEIEEALHE